VHPKKHPGCNSYKVNLIRLQTRRPLQATQMERLKMKRGKSGSYSMQSMVIHTMLTSLKTLSGANSSATATKVVA
jgi:hypothetical protein